MLPQHLLTEEDERRVVCLASGQAGRLRVRVVYQARGPEQKRAALFSAWFTADDAYQDWDDEDQDYNRSMVGAEFTTREALDTYVSGNFKAA